MIKEYILTVIDSDSMIDERKDTFICIDMSYLASVRMDEFRGESHTVIYMKDGTSYVLNAEYEDVLKDWANATGTAIFRMVSTGN